MCFKDEQSLDQDITSLSAPLENDTDQGGGGGGTPHENTDGLDGKRRLHFLSLKQSNSFNKMRSNKGALKKSFEKYQ